jgi:acyl-CoA thioesterase FadM
MMYEQTFPLSASQTDASVHLGTAEAFGLLQDGMTACLDGLHCDNLALRERGMFWVVCKARIEFLRRPAWLEPVTLRAFFTDNHLIRTHLNYTLTSPEGELLLRGVQELVPLSLAKHHPCKLTDAGFPAGPYCEAVCPAVWDRWTPDWPDAKPVYAQHIYSQHTDMSRHVNNVSYVRLILNAFSQEELLSRPIREMEIRYDRESREGENLSICREEMPEGFRFVIRRDADVICRAVIRL